jgi:hypothetical protein
MRGDPRTLIRTLSVCAISAAIVVALQLGPRDIRVWLSVCGLVSVAMSVSSLVAEPRELLVALAFALPPVMALAAEGSPTWMIAPLATVLFVGAELNALSWEMSGPRTTHALVRRRLVGIGGMAGLGLVGALAVGAVARTALLAPSLAVAVASAALAALGWVLLPNRSADFGEGTGVSGWGSRWHAR